MQGKLSVEQMCRLAGVSRAGFYRSLQERAPVDEESTSVAHLVGSSGGSPPARGGRPEPARTSLERPR